MTLEVILKRLLSSVRSFTLRTGEGHGGVPFLVTQKVIFQRLLFNETSAALLTRKRLLVDLHVFRKVTFPIKTKVTTLAGEPPCRLGLFSFSPPSACLDAFLLGAVVSENWK